MCCSVVTDVTDDISDECDDATYVVDGAMWLSFLLLVMFIE